MSRLNPEGYRKAAERCCEQALSRENPNEWVRFSLTWESIAAMSERLASRRFSRRLASVWNCRGDAIGDADRKARESRWRRCP